MYPQEIELKTENDFPLQEKNTKKTSKRASWISFFIKKLIDENLNVLPHSER